MSQVVDVAPCGDLVIAIGTGTDQKVAKVSTALLRIASSVFDKLLSPNVSLVAIKEALILSTLIVKVQGRKYNLRCL